MHRAHGAARWWSRRPCGWALPARAGALLFASFSVSCGSDAHAPFVGTAEPSVAVEGCAAPAEGCSCSSEGEQIACGEVASEHDGELVCLQGQRRCTHGVWSACSRERRVLKQTAPRGSRLSALAAKPVSCADPCDPTCSEFQDTPVGLVPGPGLVVGPGGLTLPGTNSSSSCREVVVEPPSATITVTSLEPLRTTPSELSFSARCGVDGPPIRPTWTLPPSHALIASIDPVGVFSVESPVATSVEVRANSADGQGSANVQIVVDVTSVAPDATACADVDFSAPPTTADPGSTLYPYAVAARPVVFPLGLAAPTVQWSTGGVDARCVRVSLRYPAGSDDPTFSWTHIAEDPHGGAVDDTQPALALDQRAWSAFDRSAKGDVGAIVVQRESATGGELMEPMLIPVQFASDGLRGSLYYTQYSRRLRSSAFSTTSPLCASSNQPDIDIDDPARKTAASNGCQGGDCENVGPTCPVGECTRSASGSPGVRLLDLSLPSATPVELYKDAAGSGCVSCHSLSADGSTFVANVFNQAGVPTIGTITRRRGAASLAARADAPAYSLKADRGESSAAPEREQSAGLATVAISPDGRFALQGPNFWGNTSFGQSFEQSNAQDAGYAAGGKRYFLLDVSKVRRNVDLATDDPLEEHTATPLTLTSRDSDWPLYIDGEPVWVGATVLVKDEPIASENGFYRVDNDGVSGRWSLSRLSSADELGEIRFGEKVLVESGSANFGKYFHVASPSMDDINPGSSALQISLYTTVMAATSGPLPAHTVEPSSWYGSALVGTGELPADLFDGVPLERGMSVLVKDEALRRQNGIYRLTALNPWKLRRREDADFYPALAQYARVRVNQGTLYGGRSFVLSSPNPVFIDVDDLRFRLDTELDEGMKLADGGAGTSLPTMMYPAFSPDARSLVYVSGDRDPVGAEETGWRRGLSLLDFDAANASTPFSNKRRLLNSYAPGVPGRVMKSPNFESDSESVLFVSSPPSEFCPAPAYNGKCATEDCSSSDTTVNIDSELERACFLDEDALGYGSAAPIARGYWPGQLHSVNATTRTESALTWLNSGLAAQNPALAADAGDAYQPSMLPRASGGYRWVVFTSTRAYGNQLNATGTHFSCKAPLLWMAAIDDEPAGAEDRSHPAFLVPGQNMRSITDPSSGRHYVNERPVFVPSPPKNRDEPCTADEECAGGSGAAPSARCVLDPDADPPTRRCQPSSSCLPAGEACGRSGDTCCDGAPCSPDGVCLAAQMHVAATYQRVYEAQCPMGYVPLWGDFQWHADAESSSHIDFSVRVSASNEFASATSVALGRADSSNVNVPDAEPQRVDVGEQLRANGVATAPFLQVTMALYPSDDGTVAPVLIDWNQIYDCAPAE